MLQREPFGAWRCFIYEDHGKRGLQERKEKVFPLLRYNVIMIGLSSEPRRDDGARLVSVRFGHLHPVTHKSF